MKETKTQESCLHGDSERTKGRKKYARNGPNTLEKTWKNEIKK